jgi:hypothetical protein
MVLRPHTFKYKTKLKKVDSEQINKIKTAEAKFKTDMKEHKVMEKMGKSLYGGVFVIFLSPFVAWFYFSNGSDNFVAK